MKQMHVFTNSFRFLTPHPLARKVHKTFLDMMFLCFFVFDSDGLFTSVFIDFIDCNMHVVADGGGA